MSERLRSFSGAGGQNEMIKILIFGLMVFVVLMVWACCIVAGEADRREGNFWEGKDGQQHKD